MPGSTTEQTQNPGSWRLAPPHAARAQGLIVSPFAHLSEAVALLLDASAAPGSAWLHALLNGDNALAVTPATGKAVDDSGNDAACAALAFTVTGLRLLGLDEAVVQSFAAPFVEGMHEPNRRARLGDDLLEPPGRTGRPLWGGNAPPPPGETAIHADKSVHAALLLYHTDAASLASFAAPVRAKLAASGVAIAHELGLSLQFDSSDPPIAREHFGFADGISQPSPYGDGIVTKSGKPYPRDAIHGVAAGDLVIGLIDSSNEPAPGPVVEATAPGAAATLPPVPNGPDDLQSPTIQRSSTIQKSLGLDGSYLVMRELNQDVEAFWKSMHAAAAQLDEKSADWVAERVVGRTKDGVVLARNPPTPTADGPGNDFLFFATDAGGLHCPFGSHIRRANPRDGLAPDAGDTQTLLAAANNHRILRRGRKYASYAVPDAGTLPGLLFMCLNTDLERQFEFVQQTWLLNPSFAALFDERDPLLGPAGPFTIPTDPLRLRPPIDTFIRFIGGEYFFLPSLPALTYLSGLSSNV
jgi:deferrochelatase/peroxidase EfeB